MSDRNGLYCIASGPAVALLEGWSQNPYTGDQAQANPPDEEYTPKNYYLRSIGSGSSRDESLELCGSEDSEYERSLSADCAA